MHIPHYVMAHCRHRRDRALMRHGRIHALPRLRGAYLRFYHHRLSDAATFFATLLNKRCHSKYNPLKHSYFCPPPDSVAASTSRTRCRHRQKLLHLLQIAQSVHSNAYPNSCLQVYRGHAAATDRGCCIAFEWHRQCIPTRTQLCVYRYIEDTLLPLTERKLEALEAAIPAVRRFGAYQHRPRVRPVKDYGVFPDPPKYAISSPYAADGDVKQPRTPRFFSPFFSPLVSCFFLALSLCLFLCPYAADGDVKQPRALVPLLSFSL